MVLIFYQRMKGKKVLDEQYQLDKG